MSKSEKLHTVLQVVIVGYWLVVFAAIIYTACMDPHTRTVFWYRFAQVSQAIAYRFGKVGLEAEQFYFAALERSRL